MLQPYMNIVIELIRITFKRELKTRGLKLRNNLYQQEKTQEINNIQ